MSLLQRLLLGPADKRAHPGDTGADWASIFGAGWSSPAGVDVTPETGLSSSVVFACTRVLAESVASLPLLTYRRGARGKQRAMDHPIYRLLHDRPNPEMTSFAWRELMMKYLCSWGNAACEIEWGNDGYPRGLWPLPISRLSIERTAGGQIRYLYETRDGRTVALARRNVLHVKFMGTGWWGDSPVRVGLRSLGLDLAAEEYGSRYFANGARPGMVLKHPGILGDKALANLKAGWASEHEGLSNAHRLRILEEGMDVATIGSPPDEAQFLATRQFQRSTIAGWFRVPPHMIGDLEHATFSNIEHQQIEFAVHTLRPWLVRVEQELAGSLLVGAERDDIVIEHLVDGLLRGDTLSRYQAHAVAVQNGFMSPNEVRSLENLNPYEGGDTYLLPLNMIPADQAGAPAADEATRSADHGFGCTCGQCADWRAAPHTRAEGEPTEEQEQYAGGRRRLAGAYLRLFEDGIGRLVRREVADLRRAVDKYLVKRNDVAGWLEWLEVFYDDLRGNVPPYMEATLRAMADQVADQVASERDSAVSADDLGDFMESYLGTYSGGYVASHHRQLKALTDEAQEDGTDVADHVVGRLDGWEETEARRQADAQSFEAVNALTIAAYSIVGVRFLMWMAQGESCPFCRSMSGRVAGIDAFFVEAGGSVPGANGAVLTVSRNKRHGPLHEGCDCVVVAL